MKNYPRSLSSGANNTVIALSETEAGKLFAGDSRSDIGSEGEKMRFANQINGLLVNFIRLDIYNDETEMLVMERLYPYDFRAFELERRQLWLDLFKSELAELHKAGFVHRDLKRPSEVVGQPFDNILLTHKGFRLVDVGVSALRAQVGEKLFARFVQQEWVEFANFETYLLNR